MFASQPSANVEASNEGGVERQARAIGVLAVALPANKVRPYAMTLVALGANTVRCACSLAPKRRQ